MKSQKYTQTNAQLIFFTEVQKQLDGGRISFSTNATVAIGYP